MPRRRDEDFGDGVPIGRYDPATMYFVFHCAGTKGCGRAVAVGVKAAVERLGPETGFLAAARLFGESRHRPPTGVGGRCAGGPGARPIL